MRKGVVDAAINDISRDKKYVFRIVFKAMDEAGDFDQFADEISRVCGTVEGLLPIQDAFFFVLVNVAQPGKI